jgi:hypothetical protein
VARSKWPKGTRVRVIDTADPEIAGATGHVDEVQKGEHRGDPNVMVSLDDGRYYWVLGSLLRVLSAEERTVGMPWAPPRARPRDPAQQLGLGFGNGQQGFQFRPPAGMQRKPSVAPSPPARRSRPSVTARLTEQDVAQAFKAVQYVLADRYEWGELYHVHDRDHHWIGWALVTLPGRQTTYYLNRGPADADMSAAKQRWMARATPAERTAMKARGPLAGSAAATKSIAKYHRHPAGPRPRKLARLEAAALESLLEYGSSIQPPDEPPVPSLTGKPYFDDAMARRLAHWGYVHITGRPRGGYAKVEITSEGRAALKKAPVGRITEADMRRAVELGHAAVFKDLPWGKMLHLTDDVGRWIGWYVRGLNYDPAYFAEEHGGRAQQLLNDHEREWKARRSTKPKPPAAKPPAAKPQFSEAKLKETVNRQGWRRLIRRVRAMAQKLGDAQGVARDLEFWAGHVPPMVSDQKWKRQRDRVERIVEKSIPLVEPPGSWWGTYGNRAPELDQWDEIQNDLAEIQREAFQIAASIPDRPAAENDWWAEGLKKLREKVEWHLVKLHQLAREPEPVQVVMTTSAERQRAREGKPKRAARPKRPKRKPWRELAQAIRDANYVFEKHMYQFPTVLVSEGSYSTDYRPTYAPDKAAGAAQVQKYIDTLKALRAPPPGGTDDSKTSAHNWRAVRKNAIEFLQKYQKRADPSVATSHALHGGIELGPAEASWLEHWLSQEEGEP